MKSKKKKTSKYSKPELDLDISPIVTPTVTERKMINRREIQAKIDLDKKIKAMLRSGHYNHNQIAGMLRGVTLEKVKDVSRKITT